MKVGLVLEGGGMRGMFSAGVMDVLMENGVTFDGIIGVSAGAVFGCNYKSGQIGRGYRYNKKYCKDPNYVSFRSLIFTGDMYNVDFAYHKLCDELDVFDRESFKNNPAEFYAVCTDVETGEAVYKKLMTGDNDDVEWIRASASLPVFARVVKIGDRKLLDGGMTDSIPLEYFNKIGYKKNVVILTQPVEYKKYASKSIGLIKIILRKYSKMVEAIVNRHIMYNNELEYIKNEEKNHDAYVIRPPMALDIKRIERNPQRLERAYQIGRKTAEEQLGDIIKFVNDNRE